MEQSTEARDTAFENVTQGPTLNRKQRRQQARGLKHAAKQANRLLRICQSLDTLAAVDWLRERNKGQKFNQFDALVAIHRTRLNLPGITEEESAESLAWLIEQRLA